MAGRVMCPNDPPPSPTFVHVLGFFNSCLLFFYTFLLLVLLSPQGCLKKLLYVYSLRVILAATSYWPSSFFRTWNLKRL